MSYVHWLLVLGLLSSLVFALSAINRWQPRRVTSIFLVLNTVWGIAFAFGCASLKPQLEVARSDFENACHALTQAMVGDAHPDQAEVIAQKVCYAEQVTVRVEQEIVAAQKQLFQSSPPPALLLDAGQ